MKWILLLSLFIPVLNIIIPLSFAAEHIAIRWPERGNLFWITNASPGDVINRTILIQNKDNDAVNYYFRIRIITDEHALSHVLHIRISKLNKTLFEGSMKDLAEESSGVLLSQLGHNQRNVDVSVTFDRSAGNSYQKSLLSFIAEIGSEQKTHKKHESIWEICTSYIKEVENNLRKVSDRPRFLPRPVNSDSTNRIKYEHCLPIAHPCVNILALWWRQEESCYLSKLDKIYPPICTRETTCSSCTGVG